MEHDYDDFVEHLQTHAGSTLQAVVVYEPEDHRDLYRRDDVADLHDSDLERAVLEDARADRVDRENPLADRYEGSHRATVHLFDRRVVLHLPRDRDSGTIVLLDLPAARDLATFVADIRSDLYETA